jgi:hypothetical protein
VSPTPSASSARSSSHGNRLDGLRLGCLIGGAFGLAFVEINTASLPGQVSTVLRIVAAVAFIALVALATRRQPPSGAQPNRVGHFGLGLTYWIVVAAEFAMIVVGAKVIADRLALPNAVVAWVSIVVGVHFVVLAPMWRFPAFYVLGGSVGICGMVGLIAAASDASESVSATVGGILPGVLLLGSAYWGVLRTSAEDR